MKNLQVFNYEGQEVRTVMENGAPWWVLKDVCSVLGISKYRDVASRLDEDERGSARVDTLGGIQEMTIINESGLYNVILRSDKPEAKPFRKWVTSEVLPCIHKHGAYMNPDILKQVLLNPDTIIEIATALKQEQEKNKQLADKILQDRPKVLFADAVAASDGTILVGELAKILKGNGVDIGQNRLFSYLRQEGFLIKRKGNDYNTPTQMAMDLGLFRVKETAVTHADGHVSISKTVKVTGKGQEYFVSRFLSEKIA